MNILAIDTASEYLSLALKVGSDSTYLFEKVGNLQSEFIIPKIQELLKQQGIAINDINAIAYNKGPGSFTGVRIGLSVAMGIALGLDIKLIPIPAFAILANNSIKHMQKKLPSIRFNSIIIGMDARLNQLYLAGINCSDMSYNLNPQLINPDDVANILKENNINVDRHDIVFVGSGFKQYDTQLSELVAHGLFLDLEYPNALIMLELIDQDLYLAVDVSTAEILYLRNKVALNLVEQKSIKPSFESNR